MDPFFNFASRSRRFLVGVLLVASVSFAILPAVAGAAPGDVAATAGASAGAGGAAAGSGAASAGVPPESKCTGYWNFWTTPVCWGRAVSAFIGTVFVSLTAWLLSLSGLLFNWLVDNTVVQFTTAIFNKAKIGIEAGWTAFRDAANIAIIGMFVFIAISIILGVKEYGEKKMVARVLVVAVLINFSLLFTQLIINASNFTATKFYEAASLQGGSAAATGISFTTYSQAGISGQFVKFMGLPGLGDTFDVLRKHADVVDNGFLTLLHGVFAATLLLAAALVLLYGSFLLLARALLFLFLMLVSSLAFASYLIPSLAGSDYGWRAWWQSLLGNAIFGPLLMGFLWITLQIGAAMREQTGTLGDLIAHPDKGADINALFTYLVVLGMLFLSFKFASKLANLMGATVAVNFASFMTGSAVGLASIGVGMAGRNAIGRPALAARERMRGRNWDEARGVSGFLKRGALRAADYLGAKATFTPAKPKLVSTVASLAGIPIPRSFTGKRPGEGGMEGVLKRRAQRADDLARRIGRTEGQRQEDVRRREAEIQRDRERRVQHREQIQTEINNNENIVNQLRQHQGAEWQQAQQAARQNQPGREAAQREVDQARATAEQRAREGQGTERQNAEQALTQAQNALTAVTRDRDAAAETHASRLRVIEQQAGNAPDAFTRRNLEDDAARLREARREAMAGEEERIQSAQQEITQRQQTVEQLNRAAQEAAQAEITSREAVIRGLDEEAVRMADDSLRPRIEGLTEAIRQSRAGLAADAEPVGSARQAAEAEDNERERRLRQTLMWPDRQAGRYAERSMREFNAIQNWKYINAARPPGESAPPAPPAAPPPPAR